MGLKRKIQPSWGYFFLIFAFLFGLLVNIQFRPFWQLDNIWLDSLIRDTAINNPADPDIVVIDIDELSLRNMSDLAGRWPWPRSIHGELLEHLLKQSPKAVVFDILFSEPDIFRPDGDQYLSEVIQSTDKVFLPILHINAKKIIPRPPPLTEYSASLGATNPKQGNTVPRPYLVLPHALDSSAWQLGTINFTADKDGIGRSYEVRHKIGEWSIPSLPYRVASALTDDLTTEDRITLNWRSGNAKPYTTHPYFDVYSALSEGQNFNRTDYFENKIIIIGSTAPGLHDIESTPINSVYPSLYILATAIDNLLNDDALAQWNRGYEIALVVALFASILVGVTYIVNIFYVSILILSLSGFLAGFSFLPLTEKLLFPIAGDLVLLWIFAILLFGLRYLQGQKEFAQAVELFGRFLDPNVVKNLVDQGITQELTQGRTAQVTILFSDIRNFTTLSEKHTAAEVVELLNQYFSSQVRVIFRHQGTLDKFIGDAIMAFWGEPVNSERHAMDAVEAALDMADAVEVFKRDFGAPDFDIGIGIHTGEVVAGAIGSDARYDYTIIGDAVNLASRIEGLTKGKCRVLVSATTRSGCGDNFDFKEIGDYMVKGRKEPVTVFEPRRIVK